MNSKMVIHGGWLDDYLFIWGESEPTSNYHQLASFQYPFLIDSFELKLRLFRHDRYSFYGTFIESKEAIIDVPVTKRQFTSLVGSIIIYQAPDSVNHFSFPLEGIAIHFDELLTYMPIFTSWLSDEQLTVAPDLQRWIKLFQAIQSEIIRGAFTPAPTGLWELTSIDEAEWLAAFPSSAFAIRERTAFVKEQIEASKQLHEAVRHITDSFIRHLLHEKEIAAAFKVWQQTIDTKWHPQIEKLKEQGEVKHVIATHDFREQIGLLKKKPFISGLALKEPPKNEHLWSLSLCMVDRQHRSNIVEMSELERGQHPWRENPIAQLKNDLLRAKEVVPYIENLRLSTSTTTLTTDEAFTLFTEYDEQLKELGFELIVPRWMVEKRNVQVTLKMNEPLAQIEASEPLLDWQSIASFTYHIAIGEQTVSAEDFEQFVENKRPFVQINDEWVAWDPALAEQLFSSLKQLKGKLTYFDTLHLEQDPQLAEFKVERSEQMLSMIQDLYAVTPPLIELPKTLHGTLRHYQHEGVSWLTHLRKIGFGGCLADDMGLGKSIQTIAYILHVLGTQKKSRNPFLLICPTSLLHNWVEECKKFAPSLRIFVHHGRYRSTFSHDDLKEYDVMITTYQSAVRDAEHLQAVEWNGLILDEAQQIKNVDTKQRRVIRAIQATHIIALTGTPIENRLKELWSILDVLNPTFLGSYEDFSQQFIKPIEKEKKKDTLEQLQTLIRPFILRRKKSDQSLALNLPEKSEKTHYVHLSVEQAALYQAIVDDMKDKISTVHSIERSALILRSLTKLKQICNHPAHFLKSSSLDEHESGKWTAMLSITDELVKTKKKVLIFTQYKEMGTYMQQALSKKYDVEIPFLHGSLTRKKRQQMIDRFQDESTYTPIFILSLKAGGVGLNLTAATNVIHYDRWWNPAVENQATDRVYRIGQTNDVTVHKLITIGTLEERIDEMLTKKQQLVDDVLLAGEQPITNLSNEELVALISLQG